MKSLSQTTQTRLTALLMATIMFLVGLPLAISLLREFITPSTDPDLMIDAQTFGWLLLFTLVVNALGVKMLHMALRGEQHTRRTARKHPIAREIVYTRHNIA